VNHGSRTTSTDFCNKIGQERKWNFPNCAIAARTKNGAPMRLVKRLADLGYAVEIKPLAA